MSMYFRDAASLLADAGAVEAPGGGWPEVRAIEHATGKTFTKRHGDGIYHYELRTAKEGK